MPKNTSLEPETGPKTEAKRIDIPSLHDVNIQDYCDWLKSRVKTEAQKAEYQKATDFLVESAFDLDLLYEDQNPTFLNEEGKVEAGIARRFVKDIEHWAKRRRTDDSTEHFRILIGRLLHSILNICVEKGQNSCVVGRVD